jgi:outer membrane immunogenic protein
MHRHVVASLAVASLSVGLTAAASAADLGQPAPAPVYTKAPPIAPPSWTGFYIGANAGYGWSASSSASFSGASVGSSNITDFFADNEFPASLSPMPKGFVGGGEIGYNWQVAPTWLLGLEADFQGSDINGTDTQSPIPTVSGLAPFTTSLEERIRWFGTVRGRAGFLPTDNVLIYGTGGLAYGQTEISFNTVPSASAALCTLNFTCASGSASTTSVGWTAGAGLEWMIAPHWTVKAEYLYVDLGTLSVTGDTVPSAIPPGSFTASGRFREDIVRGGVNFKF